MYIQKLQHILKSLTRKKRIVDFVPHKRQEQFMKSKRSYVLFGCAVSDKDVQVLHEESMQSS